MFEALRHRNSKIIFPMLFSITSVAHPSSIWVALVTLVTLVLPNLHQCTITWIDIVKYVNLTCSKRCGIEIRKLFFQCSSALLVWHTRVALSNFEFFQSPSLINLITDSVRARLELSANVFFINFWARVRKLESLQLVDTVIRFSVVFDLKLSQFWLTSIQKLMDLSRISLLFGFEWVFVITNSIFLCWPTNTRPFWENKTDLESRH